MRAGELLLVSLPWLVSGIQARIVGVEHREWPLLLDDWRGVSRERMRVLLPPGYEVASKPSDLNLSCSQGRYSRTLREESPAAFVLESSLELDALRVEPEEYDTFRRFLTGVHRAQKELVALRVVDVGPDVPQPDVSGR